MVTINYKDSKNWQTLEGKVISWERYAEHNKDGRIVPTYLAPIIISETWDDRVYEAQHIRWNAWVIEFWIKESEIHHLSKMQSCSDIVIRDDTGLQHVADTGDSEGIIFDEPERVSDTSAMVVRIIYKTDKTVIDKLSLGVDIPDTALHSMTLEYNEHGANVEDHTFKTNMPTIDLPLTPEMITFDKDDGIRVRAKTITRNAKKVCFYLTNLDATYFVDLFARAQYRALDGQDILDSGETEVTKVGGNLTRIVIEVVMAVKVAYPKFYNTTP